MDIKHRASSFILFATNNNDVSWNLNRYNILVLIHYYTLHSIKHFPLSDKILNYICMKNDIIFFVKNESKLSLKKYNFNILDESYVICINICHIKLIERQVGK